MKKLINKTIQNYTKLLAIPLLLGVASNLVGASYETGAKTGGTGSASCIEVDDHEPIRNNEQLSNAQLSLIARLVIERIVGTVETGDTGGTPPCIEAYDHDNDEQRLLQIVDKMADDMLPPLDNPDETEQRRQAIRSKALEALPFSQFLDFLGVT